MIKGTGGFLDPDKIVQEFDIKKGDKVADFGCGAGYFTICMAKIVGDDGKIYAFDVLKTALESVENKAKSERTKGLLNIETIWSNLETPGGSKLEDEFVDLVLLANILFQSSKKADIIKEAKRVVKKGGKMIVIDWEENQPMGPAQDRIVSKDLIKKIAENEDFKFEREFKAGTNHWGLIFTK